MSPRSSLLAATFGALLLAGCGDEATPAPVVEVLQLGPVVFDVEALGELKAAEATRLVVPGQGFAQRQLIWVVADGTPVKEGELIARFAAEQTQLELDKALLNLERNALLRAGKEAELAATEGRLDVDLAQVQGELAIASRYAQADLEALARNVVLDAVADERYLGEKREVLDWRKGQGAARGGAELQVLDAQRETVAIGARTRETELEALELRAPHEGVVVLSANWTGEKPQVGAPMWSGNDFASLPDARALEVEFTLPQIEAQVLAVGQPVRLHPLGRPDLAFEAPISWVASAPRTVSRNSPVKYLAFKVAVPAEVRERGDWVPGLAFEGRVQLRAEGEALSVPNLALRNEGGATVVDVWVDGAIETRRVALGVRGPARSEVREGLAPGDAVVLSAASVTPAVDATPPDDGARARRRGPAAGVAP